MESGRGAIRGAEIGDMIIAEAGDDAVRLALAVVCYVCGKSGYPLSEAAYHVRTFPGLEHMLASAREHMKKN
jgi:hypothetical protein